MLVKNPGLVSFQVKPTQGKIRVIATDLGAETESSIKVLLPKAKAKKSIKVSERMTDLKNLWWMFWQNKSRQRLLKMLKKVAVQQAPKI